MTIKQFAYVVTGVIFAWIFFSLPIDILLKLPFSLFFLCFGAALAFLPVEGRPLDLMVTYFFKALFSPTQFLFAKGGAQIIPPLPHKIYHPVTQEQSKTISQESLQTLLASSNTYAPKNELDQKEMLFLNSISSTFQGITSSPQPTPPIIQPTPQELIVEKPEEKKIEAPKLEGTEEVKQELEEQTQILKEELNQAKEEAQQAEAKGVDNQKVEEENQKVNKLEQLLNETILQKNALEQQLLSLQKQLDVQKIQPPASPTPNVQKAPPTTTKNPGLSVAMENPNLIAGIIKDPRGNVLPNILVEIRDQEGNPVRAFKTNKLGQFASATPLLNGSYTIVFEDPAEAQKFEPLEIIARGEPIPPVEIASRDAREELRKSLFSV